MKPTMQITTTLASAFVAALAFAHSCEVEADVPKITPIQGRIASNDGTALEGDHTVQFAVYDAEESELFNETQVVAFEGGEFTAYLGAIQTLDVSVMERAALLGIAIDGDEEMAPRIPFGSVPFAMHTPQLPTGMVSHFDLPDCPVGWSPLAAAQGRAIVGTPEDGTLLGSVGTQLEDLEDREHTHTVDPGAIDTDQAGGHTHDTAAQAGLNTNLVSVPHTHAIPGQVGVTSEEVHNHQYLSNGPAAFGSTYNSTGGNVGFGPSSPSIVPWNGIPAIPFGDLYTDNDSHDHTVTTNPSISGGSSSTSHGHVLTVPAQTTTSNGTHVHPVDIPSTASSSASTSDTMPYVQLTACRKD